jgi:hypothetical protein
MRPGTPFEKEQLLLMSTTFGQKLLADEEPGFEGRLCVLLLVKISVAMRMNGFFAPRPQLSSKPISKTRLPWRGAETLSHMSGIGNDL